jgi:hypothetical protein
MLSNEVFALACRAWYEEQGLIVDACNGEFAHCPLPERYGDTGYYLLHEHHQHQGLLQSRDIGECCFFIGHARKWLQECDYFPDDYFELWTIYDEYCSVFSRKVHEEKDDNGKSLHTLKHNENLHEEKDENGKSLHAVKMGKKAHEEKDENGRSLHALSLNKKLHEEKDENGKSLHTMRHNEKLHEEKDESGRSLHSLKMSEKAHEKKDENGKSVTAVKAGNKSHEKKDELGRSVTAMITNTQVWESTKDGFKGNPGAVAKHNKARGWDPDARVRVA